MLPEIKKIKLYTAKDHPAKKMKIKMTYPGTRSKNLYHEKPILWNYINDIIIKHKILDERSWNIDTFLHLRLDKDKDKDWIHKDQTEDFAALIYLSETNLNSGTKIYDENDNMIDDIKFVQNRLIMYSANYKHMGYGHHGKDINDGRLTLNLFIKMNE